MKLPFPLLAAAVVFLPSSLLFAQGSLTPPGAPAPTMKTLEQIEPRKEINALNTPGDASCVFRITAPGSYYLGGNIAGVAGKNGIIVGADDVTIDLNGFELLGVAGSTHGITTTATRNLHIFNGSIRGWALNGVEGGVVRGGVLERVRVSDNGGTGMRVTSGWVISHCTATGNTSNGFEGSRILAGPPGLSSTLTVFEACVSVSNGGSGFTGIINLRNCTAAFNTTGFSVQEGSIADCAATGNDTGILARGGVLVRGNSVVSSSVAGILIANGASASTRNVVEGNSVVSGGIGLDVDWPDNVIRGNTVRANTDNYSLVAGIQVEILLCQLPETIDVPATVVLAGDLTGIAGSNGILITADHVTIDLAGHALVGIAGSLDGVLVSGIHSNISVRNGTVNNWDGDGIDTSSAVQGAVSDVQLLNNGVGLRSGSEMFISKVAARGSTSTGILAEVACQVVDCIASTNGNNGIAVGDASSVERCNLYDNAGNGIVVGNTARVIGNTCDLHNDVGMAGILVSGDRNRIDGNFLARNATGLSVPAAGNFNVITRNSASGNAANYSIVGANNDVGPLGTAAAATSPWANLQN